MEPRISLVTLAVADMARSRAFYGALGWEPKLAMEDVTFYQAGGMAFGLWHRKPFAEETGLPTTRGGLCLAHNVRDRAAVDALLHDAGKAGAKVQPAKAQEWGGYSGFFRDPDGHLWEVAWNPAWTLDGDGNVRLD
jgi:uncharacterized protein